MELKYRTVECSNYDDSCLYVSFDLTSAENVNAFHQMSEVDPRYFVSDSTHSYVIAANSPEELEKLAEVFTIQDVKEKRYMPGDEFLERYKCYMLNDIDSSEFIDDYGYVDDPYEVSSNGSFSIKEKYKFRKSRISSTLNEALSESQMQQLYVEGENRVYNSLFYLQWHMRYLNREKMNQQIKK